MELQQRVASLEGQLRKHGRFLRATFGLLILTIGFLVTPWVLATEGRLDVRGKRVYVHGGGGSLVTSTIRPQGLEAHGFNEASLPFGRHALLTVAPERADLRLRVDSADQNRDIQLFVAGDRSGLSIRDGQQRERVSLALHEDGPKLLLLDEKGQTLFQAP